ncbi:MAG: hypothetical protein ACJLS2_00425 [Microcella pacifica]
MAAFVPSTIDNRDDLTAEQRVQQNLVLLVVVFALVLISGLITFVSQRKNHLLESRIALLNPHRALRNITDALFPKGNWRLTLMERTPGGLERRAVIAHNPHAATSGITAIELSAENAFYTLFSRNLSIGSRDNKHEPGATWATAPISTGDGTVDWNSWFLEIFGGPDLLEFEWGGMKPRRVAWAAAKDDDTNQTWAVVCESEDPDGIDDKYLAERDTSTWILLWARLQSATAPDSVQK